jgi:hypothetical protein
MLKGLSHNDSNVLSALFDPEASLARIARIEDTSYTTADTLIQQQDRDALLLIDQEQPKSADIKLAILALTKIIEAKPDYASAWNNRAQARRLLIEDNNLWQSPMAVAEIMADRPSLGHAPESLPRLIRIGVFYSC